jgi:hypothetical protein
VDDAMAGDITLRSHSRTLSIQKLSEDGRWGWRMRAAWATAGTDGHVAIIHLS